MGSIIDMSSRKVGLSPEQIDALENDALPLGARLIAAAGEFSNAGYLEDSELLIEAKCEIDRLLLSESMAHFNRLDPMSRDEVTRMVSTALATENEKRLNLRVSTLSLRISDLELILQLREREIASLKFKLNRGQI